MNIFTHNGVLTVRSTRTGDHRTFRIRTQPNDSKFAPGERVLSMLFGPDNTSDYRGFAFVKDDRLVIWNKHKGTQMEELANMLVHLDRFESKGLVEINFEGRCRKCNRALTTPESVESGIGPICSGRTT